MAGMFINSKEAKFWMYGIAAIAVVVWIIVVVGSFGKLNWIGSSNFFADYAG